VQFNSLAFAAFIAVVLSLYFVAGLRGHVRTQNVLLLASSYFFYGWWDWRFLGLLAVSTVVDYAVGIGIANHVERTQSRRGPKGLLLVSLFVNLTILGVFKYFDFFVNSAGALLSQFGLEPNLPLLNVILPVGISFYTFQTIAYTYSVYKGDTPATRDFVSFAVYVAYFPQLVAGPIERAQRLLPQIQSPRHTSAEQFKTGCQLILLGLFKKIAIADAVAGHVQEVYSDPGACSSSTLLMGTYLFAMQIYGDFSGYTDIARGVSRVMGIELILNFRQPYLASNITDFWRRWHISLSTWLKEHLYIPLGGNRHGTAKTYRNLMLTMLLGGLWHGAGWNFVIWGGLHGLYLAVHKLWMSATSRTVDAASGVLRKLIGGLVTFHLVCLAWIFFRAANEKEQGPLRVAWQVIEGIGKCEFKPTDQVPWTAMLLIPVALMIDYLSASRNRQLPLDARTPLFFRGLVYGSAVVMILLANSSGDVPFIYFRF
jgi:D-alanyl-lipoteichoic acid acyltransferase DltB (MBOAT superfamily)